MTIGAYRRSSRGGALILLLLASDANAHDLWINQQRRTNGSGEWCCNALDCRPVPDEEVRVTPHGYVLENGELIPHSEAAMSGDGRYWRCQRPDKTTRCFFFPPPAT